MYLFDVRYDVSTAGPGLRTEVYFSGCSKALSGNPCKGCFNTLLWKKQNGFYSDVDTLVKKVVDFTPQKLISFCGGEPTDQLDELIKVCEKLKKYNFNILVYTYKYFSEIKYIKKYIPLFENIDILIDGVYQEKNRIYNTTSKNWIYRSIGSSNQNIIKFSHKERGEKICWKKIALPI